MNMEDSAASHLTSSKSMDYIFTEEYAPSIGIKKYARDKGRSPSILSSSFHNFFRPKRTPSHPCLSSPLPAFKHPTNALSNSSTRNEPHAEISHHCHSMPSSNNRKRKQKLSRLRTSLSTLFTCCRCCRCCGCYYHARLSDGGNLNRKPLELPTSSNNITPPNSPAIPSRSMQWGDGKEGVLVDAHATTHFSEPSPETEGGGRDVSSDYWEVRAAPRDAVDEDDSPQQSDFSDGSLPDRYSYIDSCTDGDHQARRRERRRRHKLRKGLSYDEPQQVVSEPMQSITTDGGVGTESDDSTLKAKTQSVVSTTTVEYAEESPVLVTCLDDGEEQEEEDEDDMYQSVETMVETADAVRSKCFFLTFILFPLQ
ncbi:unnamed protein product [Schistocephalus solidus]|uniref:Uncharacterized protein n=1 Tax=Schistocephalus solidus TaxID=70667 RepID=A0A183S982_SCHSO|nr:unnamed protein product [Schistocephalus solidus]